MRLPSRFTAALAGLALAVGLVPGSSVPAEARNSNPPTPGAFTGYGFDQCVAPTQKAMDAWLEHSPFQAVGIYISGDSRGCRTQPNLTPTWVSTQLAKGWRLLPIALGPQARCHPSFPRYGDDPTIKAKPGPKGRYPRARRQGRAEAVKNAADARALGLAPGSTIFYDLEGFDHTKRHCRESALAFVSAWNLRMRKLGYVTGLYSSASSGIAMVDAARRNRPGQFNLPQQIWIARWDGVADTSTTYIPEDGWRPGGRLKQYRGDHHETWGGVRINIDSNWLELGQRPSALKEQRCGGTRVSFPRYGVLKPKKNQPARTRALQCLLKETGHYQGRINGKYTKKTRQAARAWQASKGLPVKGRFNRRHWVALHAQGDSPLLKVGATGPAVRRVQRALNAAIAPKVTPRVKVNGLYNQRTEAAMKRYQSKLGHPASGIANRTTWALLQAGRR